MITPNFQDFILNLCQYWVDHGCIWSQPYDAQMGAGTFHPHTFLKGIGPEPWRSVYVQPCRRPVDGRYGKSPYRFQHYYQLQVLLKPSPANILDVFLRSLESVGIDLKKNDIGLLEDDWKGPTLGAWGLGWEVRANGQEVTQFTYFQQLGGMDVEVICGEITYGLERLYMYANGIKDGMQIPYNEYFTYGDIYLQNEYEFSFYNFKEANVTDLFSQFDKCEEYVSRLCEKNLILPAYDHVLQASHAFNLLDARGAISASERQRFIGRVRECAKKCALKYREWREKMGFPLKDKVPGDARQEIYSISSSRGASERNDLIVPLQESGVYTSIDQLNKYPSLDVLFELGVEEMPPAFQMDFKKELSEKWELLVKKLKDQFKNSDAFIAELQKVKCTIEISSRRASLYFASLPKKEPDQEIEIWGPSVRIAREGNGTTLTQAGLGFCRKNGINPDECEFKEKADGLFLYAKKRTSGRDFPSLLAQEFKDWCYSAAWPLKMRWLPSDISPPFVRPVRWVLMLVEDLLIPMEMFGLKTGRTTCGQRILSPQSFPVDNVKKYYSTLQSINVEFSQSKRRTMILQMAEEVVSKSGGHLLKDDFLLNKCVGMFENPTVFLGEFDRKFLRLPKALVTSVLREHMNYFSVVDAKGNMLPYYVGVANYNCSDFENMIKMTQDVVVGRLEDGAFYYDTDLSTPLNDMKENLKSLTFQENMGSVYDKSERIKFLSSLLLNKLKENEKTFAAIDFAVLNCAADFCKADLKSGCVQEFPDEMQGVMGSVLAKEQNIMNNAEKSSLVSAAIHGHYQPVNPSDPLPTSIYATLVSIADKMDSLCMMVNHNYEVKGNKDPLGLRRLSIAIVRLLGAKKEENAIPLTLHELFESWAQMCQSFNISINADTKGKVETFFIERIKSILKDLYSMKVVECLSGKYFYFNLSDMNNFAMLLNENFNQAEQSESLSNTLVPFKRVKKILAAAPANLLKEKKLNTSLLNLPYEKNLYTVYTDLKGSIQTSYLRGDYKTVIESLSALSKPLSEFFDNVLVNDPVEELKTNRILLLFLICSLYEDVANFSVI